MEIKSENKYTSLELSKKLEESGCKLESNYWFVGDWENGENPEMLYFENGKPNSDVIKILYPAYDILNDICVKYAKEFFGEKIIKGKVYARIAGDDFDKMLLIKQPAYIIYARQILYLLQQNKKQKAENYIWRKTIFNKENKK